jgi:uncharacterized membrane protein YoaK (UPF0700 family)
MLTKEGQGRSQRENIVLAFALACVAGAVNGVGLQELGVFTSHMSGAVSRVGESLARHDRLAFHSWVGMIFSYLGGAMLATLFVERAKILGRARYSAALLLEAIILAAFTAASVMVPEDRAPWLHVTLTNGLCFAMGLQNALVTKISGAVIRTTHLTGIITDFGIELVRLIFWLRERTRGQSALDRLWQLSRIVGDAELYKARLHLTIILSFLSSGALATALYLHFGRVAMALPVTVLVLLVIYDRFLSKLLPQSIPPPVRVPRLDPLPPDSHDDEEADAHAIAPETP